MQQHRLSELLAVPVETIPAQPSLPPGTYILVPTTGYSPAQVAAIQQLYQQAWEQAQTQPRRNFRWEQAHQPRWN